MKLGGILRFVRRDSRGSRGSLVFFVACVAIGVAAVVAVDGVARAIDAGLRSRSRELLAADIAVQGRQPLPAELDAAIARVAPDAERIDVRELATMAGALSAAGDVERSRLCELKVVDAAYPFYGELTLEPAGRLADLLDASTAVVAPELMSGLGLAVGDTVRVGGADFRVAAVVLDEPDRLDFALVLGPRVFLSSAGFDRTSLLGVGNRVKYRALLRLPGNPVEDELDRVKDELDDSIPATVRLRFETHFEAQPGVRRGLERFASFLGLVALLSLVLGGIGVAEVVRSWLRSRTIGIAVWRVMGLRPREILVLHVAHIVVFALIGSVLGAVLGGAVPFALPALMPDLLSADLVESWQPLALLRGIGLGVGVALLFALSALTAVWRVSPALVLRSDAEPLPAPRLVRIGALLLLGGGLFASAWIQGGRADYAGWFTGGLAVLALLLFLGARALVWCAGVLPRGRFGPTVAHGIAALARPGVGTVGAIVSLGLGTLVVTGMALIERRLQSELRGALPENAPSVFLVDVQPDQWEAVERVLADGGADRIDMVPVIMARLAAIRGDTVASLVEDRGDDDERERGERDEGDRRPRRWALTREQRLTWLDELPDSNRVTARLAANAADDVLWRDPERDEISLEEDYAENLGVGVGDSIAFDVQGLEFEFLVSSLRQIEWESFDINFFVVVEPGALDDAPQMLLAAARVASSAEDAIQDQLVQSFPNVTMLRIRPILEKVADLLGRIALGIRVLGAFTILAGVAILAGSVGASRLRRGNEVALLKTLGVTRRGVLQLFAMEFALSGLVAGALGAAGAYALAWGFLEHVVELEADLPPLGFVLAMGLTATLAVTAGIAASLRALRARPIESLR